MNDSTLRLGLLGFGEAGQRFAADFVKAGLKDVVTYSRSAAAAGAADPLRVFATEHGIEIVMTPKELCKRANLIIALTPGKAALPALRSIKRYLGEHHIYVDANTVGVKTIERIATLLDGRCAFVDAAIMSAVPLDGIKALNEMNAALVGDPETHTRIAQYEMAFRMQASVPELTELSSEPESTFELYGNDAKKPGTFANTALTARRLVERGVRFVQIYHNNWDHHGNLPGRMQSQCKDVDQACHGLIKDLKLRGLWDETLVIWGGEFGRTIYSQGGLSPTNYGRDHHPRCFTMWLGGGGIKGGTIYGATDDFSYNIVENPVHIRDLHATLLHLLGYDHLRLGFKHQGLDQRLTGVEPAHVVKPLLA